MKKIRKLMNNRERGNRYERKLAKEHREDLLFDNTVTTRAMSKRLDDAKIDLWGVPVWTQAKYGKQTGLKPGVVLKQMKDGIANIYGKKSLASEMPFVIVHGVDARIETNELVHMTKKDYYKLLRMIYDEDYRKQNAEIYRSVFGIMSRDS